MSKSKQTRRSKPSQPSRPTSSSQSSQASQGARPAQSRRKAPPPARKNLVPLLLILGVLVLSTVFVVYRTTRGNAPSSVAAALADEISVEQAALLRQSGAFMLDVRQPEEWAEYHMPGSTLIPLDQLASRLDEIPRDQQIVVVCRSGNRSQEGRNILRQAGFTQVTSMAGGLLDWRNQGLPTVSDQ